MLTAVFEKPVEQWFDGEYARIPERMQVALKNYFLDHLPVGGFLTALFSNDLRNTFWRADDENVKMIELYVQWLNSVDYGRTAWGSPEIVADWLKNKVEDQVTAQRPLA